MPHGRYSLVCKIADGGTAEVFLAHMEGSAGFRRLVVLKQVLPGLWADESFRKMLIDEAHISMALHHSNIVQVLDLGLAADRYFLVLELVDGWTLSQVVSRAKAAGVSLPLNLGLHILGETCRALAYAHSRTSGGVSMGIVHRDVTPQNVLVSEQGEVKLTDFGIAKARSRLTISQIGQVKGKPAFMSPEQATGRDLDARSDLFAVGVMTYWLATGELPFVGPTPLASLTRTVHGDYVPPEQKQPGLPAPVVKLIKRALEGDVERRFQSADEMLSEIESIERTVLEPAGQTELKRWLASLAAKDGAQPIGRVASLPPTAASGSIELVDEQDILPSTAEHSTPAPLGRDFVPTQRRPVGKSRADRWVLALSLLALAGTTAWWLTRPQPVAPAPAPVVAEPEAPSIAEPDAGRAAEAEPERRGSSLEDEILPWPLDAKDPSGEEHLAEVDTSAVEPDEAAPEEDAVDAGASEALVDAGASPALADAAVAGGRAAVAPVALAPGPKPVRAPAPPRKPPPPPPALTPDPTMISVRVDSEPAGATVTIDKRVYGKTPLPLRLKIGISFKLVVSKPGYHTQEALYFVTRRPGQRVRVTLPTWQSR